MSPRRDRKSETTTREKWPLKFGSIEIQPHFVAWLAADHRELSDIAANNLNLWPEQFALKSRIRKRRFRIENGGHWYARLTLLRFLELDNHAIGIAQVQATDSGGRALRDLRNAARLSLVRSIKLSKSAQSSCAASIEPITLIWVYLEVLARRGG